MFRQYIVVDLRYSNEVNGIDGISTEEAANDMVIYFDLEGPVNTS